MIIKDFVLQLGFDASEVERGMSDVLRNLTNMNNQLGASMQSHTRELRDQVDLQNRQRANQTRADVLEARRLRTLTAISRVVNNTRFRLEGQDTDVARDALQDLQDSSVRLRSQLRDAGNALDMQRVSNGLSLLNQRMQQAIVSQNRLNVEADRAGRDEIRRRALLSRLNRVGSSGVARLGDFSQVDNTGKIRTLTKSVSNLRKEILEASSAADFSRLGQSITDLSVATNRAVGQSRRLNNELLRQRFITRALKSSVTNLATSYISAFAAINATTGLVNIGQNFQSLNASLLAASGNSQAAAEDFKFLIAQSTRLGIDVETATKGYQKFATASRAAGFSTEQTRQIFVQMSEASVGMGLTTEDTFGVFNAFAQILSKGKVSAEELRGQLGDRLPIAMAAAIKSSGKTSEEFTKLLESGQIVSKDFLPGFARELQKVSVDTGALGAQLNTSRVQMARFRTAFKLNIVDSFNEGIEEGLVQLFKQLTNSTEDMSVSFKNFGALFGGFLETLATVIQALTPPFRLLSLVMESLITNFTRIRDANDETIESFNLLERFVFSLIKVFKQLAAVVLLPFALLELATNTLAEKDRGGFGPLIDGLAILLGATFLGKLLKLVTLLGRFLGFGKKAKKTAEGVDSLDETLGRVAKKTGKVGLLAKALKTLFGFTPFGRLILALTTLLTLLPKIIDFFQRIKEVGFSEAFKEIGNELLNSLNNFRISGTGSVGGVLGTGASAGSINASIAQAVSSAQRNTPSNNLEVNFGPISIGPGNNVTPRDIREIMDQVVQENLVPLSLGTL